ncbi:unnamed protein product [Sympodiomycopsis kandeliae]
MTTDTLALPFVPRAGYTPSAPAIILPPSSPHCQAAKSSAYHVSYHHLSSLISSLQSQLAALGLQDQDAVSSSLINGIEFAVAFLATGCQRLIAAPLNPAYTQSEVEFYLGDTKSKVLLVPQGTFTASRSSSVPTVEAAKKLNVAIYEIVFDPLASDGRGAIYLSDEAGRSLPRNDGGVKTAQPDDVTLVLHTSGTTGRPKGVPLSHLNLITTMKNIINTYDLTSFDRTFLVMPLFHVHGLQAAFLSTLLSGGTVVIPPKFSAGTFWSELQSTRCTWYTAVPTIHSILLSSPKPSPLPPLRFIRSCSSSLAPTTLYAIEEAFKAPVLEAYAMTEASHQMTSNPLPGKNQGVRLPGSVGIPQGVEVRILDGKGDTLPTDAEGEVCIRGANVTKGYLNNPKANAESFIPQSHTSNAHFFRTGDQGKLTSEGFLILTGRIKELINRGGEKISPLEIDSALLSLAGIKEAVSFGIEDSKYGQIVGAAVVTADSNLNEKKIQEALGDKVAKFKIPTKVFIVQSIPKTATGKIQRRNVAASVLSGDKAKL